MSIQGKKMAMINHAYSVMKAVVENVKTNFNNPLLMELGLVHIRAQAGFTTRQLQSTPAERFNDDGTLKPAPELQHGEWRIGINVPMHRLEKEYIPREPKNFEASV